jgi:hypothetical protein
VRELARQCLGQVRWADLALALAVSLPLLVAELVSGEQRLVRAATVSVCALIAAERGRLTLPGSALQGVAILLGYLTLGFARTIPLIFVLGCAGFAAITLAITWLGAGLRSAANFTFIPALYLATQTTDRIPSDQLPAVVMSMVPYLAVALVPPLCVAGVRQVRASSVELALSDRRGWTRAEDSPGEAVGQGVISIAAAVAVSATIVEVASLTEGQWAIWSAASVVIAADPASSGRKLRDRAIAAAVGVPIGAAIGFLAAGRQLAVDLAVVASLLTLVAFRSYRLGFGTRSLFAAVAIVAADAAPTSAAIRLGNVLLGGVLGVISVAAAKATADQWHRSHTDRQPDAGA